MNWRQAPPGSEEQNPAQPELVDPTEAQWQQYVRLPPREGELPRLGICCSGGGIRSASYCLGALQALAERANPSDQSILQTAEYLSAVSGGGYTAIAHTTLVSATLGDFDPADGGDEGECEAAPSGMGGPAHEDEFFRKLPPWAPASSEERHLRDNSSYLADGAVGKVWLAVNVVYGTIRHLLPFAALIVVAGTITGFSFSRWLGPILRSKENAAFPDLTVVVITVGALLVTAGVVLYLRRMVQQGSANSASLLTLQRLTLLAVGAAAAVAFLLLAMPAVLWVLSLNGVDKFLTSEWLGGESKESAPTVFLLSGVTGSILAALALRARREVSKRGARLIPLMVAILGTSLLLVPYVGITYWVAFHGLHFSGLQGNPGAVEQNSLPLIVGVVAAVLLLALSFTDQVTPNMHLFYRERLANAFIGKRVRKHVYFSWEQPPWHLPLRFSCVSRDLFKKGGRLPKLVVCAAVNLSRTEPPGRNAASFTFESDWSGGPSTGYVGTKWLEDAAGQGVLTLPAMMAISGAALSPSMGKLSKPGLRLLLALFNVRLGVWLPNPRRHRSVSPYERRQMDEPPAPDRGGKRAASLVRPGTLYVLREALGMNSPDLSHAYVSDGGHWENLGLVELLRRGCNTILCFDAAGDSPGKFYSLADAVALARADLNIHIEVPTERLVPQDGRAPTDVVEGSILFPDGSRGRLIYAKATMPLKAPQDLVSFQEKDPKFPAHSTGDQFFNERKYESYRTLGYHAARRAMSLLD